MDIELSQVRETFIAESKELLQEMENALLTLEASPADEDTINSLFRTVHTLKGSSGVLGMERVERFAHTVENVLSKVRDGVVGITNEIIELLLACRDHIQALVGLSADDAAMPKDLADLEMALIGRLNAYLGHAEPLKDLRPLTEEELHSGPDDADRAMTDAWHISIRFGLNTFKNGMDPVSFINYLGRLGEIISLATLCESMPRAPEMAPESCYMGLEIAFKSNADKKAISDVFEFIKEDSTVYILPPHSSVDAYVRLIQGLPEDTSRLGEILVNGGTLTEAELKKALEVQTGEAGQKGERTRLLGEILVSKGAVHHEVVEAAVEKQRDANGKRETGRGVDARTVRINAGKLDALINLVGELVIAGANIEQHSRRVGDPSLAESSSVMLRLVEEVRETSMKLRMVPIGETFSRFNRVVRDMSRESGKEINLVISGGDTELDKTVIEKISDPLMHLVRNSIDHGIETNEARSSSGKPASGTIRLNAFHDAGCIVIEVMDDGKGLDREKILDKAARLGMVEHGQTLTEREILGLIFEPGFSTADAVTKLSGRGVGMDVVRKNIESLRGTVEVESSAGKGTTVRIRLPLTLAIIDGFMVGLDRSYYIVPLDMVVECVELTAEDREAAVRRRYINLRGELLPYVRLREIFDVSGLPSRYEHVVIVQYAGQKTGLVVDGLYGEVQTVIKSLGRVYRDVEGISGATILGTGHVALILDVPRLVQLSVAGADAGAV